LVKPYKELKLGKYILRYFSCEDPKQLFWHRDNNERKVKILFGFVRLQLEDNLPFYLMNFKTYLIPKMTFHRVLSKSPFLILIKEK
jgi:hypothetical protein